MNIFVLLRYRGSNTKQYKHVASGQHVVSKAWMLPLLNMDWPAGWWSPSSGSALRSGRRRGRHPVWRVPKFVARKYEEVGIEPCFQLFTTSTAPLTWANQWPIELIKLTRGESLVARHGTNKPVQATPFKIKSRSIGGGVILHNSFKTH